MIEERQYTSTELVRLLPGLTNRQLQWWHERKMIKPDIRSHKRQYSLNQALAVGLVMELKRKNQTLQKIRKSLRMVEKLMAEQDVDLVMLDAKQQPVIALTPESLLEKALDRPQPLILISLAEVRYKLTGRTA